MVCKHFRVSAVCITLTFTIIQYCSSAPIDSSYAISINTLKNDNCSSPEQVKLPLNSSAPENAQFLSSYLNVCQNLETLDRQKEGKYLCREIFDNFKVILCPPYNDAIINSSNLKFSKQVCKEIGSMKNTIPKNKVLLQHLTDSLTCELLCDPFFEKACQVLLWSYQVQMQFESTENSNKAANVENPVQQENTLIQDKAKIEDSSTVQEIVHVNSDTTQRQVKKTSNIFIPGAQKTNSVLEHQSDKTPTEVKPDVFDDAKEAGANSVAPLHQGSEVKNSSLVGSKIPLDEVENDLPQNRVDSQDPGIAEMEDPHDNDELFHDHDINLPQHPDNAKPIGHPSSNELPRTDEELPHANENAETQHINANEGLPQQPADEEKVDPHDGEEPGESESSKTDTKTTVQENTASQTRVDGSSSHNQNKAPTQEKAATTIVDKTAVATGSSKNSITTTEKKVETSIKTSSPKVSLKPNDQKASANLLPLPSQKEDASSNIVPHTGESPSPTTVALEKMEEGDNPVLPEDKRQEQYTDLEKNEGEPDEEYARPDYDGGMYEPAKNKEFKPEKPNEVEVAKMDVSPIDQNFHDFSREKYGREPNDIPLVFPEQEDSHFFFYFLSLVVIVMAGYLIFHNKQKIIALIVEGRHERKRRSHGVGYKKLETK